MTPISRRDFVATAAAAGLAAPALSRFAPRVAGSDTLRVGLIGCGGRGTGAAVQALRGDKGTVLVAMADLFEDRMRSSLAGITEAMEDQASQKVQVKPDRMHVGFDAYEKVINSDVDVVLLTTTPNFRPQHIEAAVKAGKHIFAEKPMAVDAPGVRKVLAAAAEAKRKNLALVSGFCWRYGNAERAVFERINAGDIGEVMAAHTT